MASSTTSDRINWRDNPRARATHYAHGAGTTNGGLASTQQELATNGNSDVVGYTWKKDTEAPTGTLTLEVVPRQDYLFGPNRIKADDLILLESEANDGLTQSETQQKAVANIITLVLVDRVGEAVTIGPKGEEERVLRIHCSDFGKVLEKTSIVVDPGVAQAIGAPALIGTSGFGEAFLKIFGTSANAGGAAFTPNQAILNLFNVVLAGSPIQFQLPNSSDTFQSLVDPFTYVQKVMIGATLVTNPFGLDVNTTLWGLMKQFSNEFLNELFVDVRYENPKDAIGAAEDRARIMIEQDLGGVPAELQDTRLPGNRQYVLSLVFRQRPYDADAFNALPAVQVFTTECWDIDISYASHEVFNIFRVWGLQAGATIYGEHFEYLVNQDSVKKHGALRFEPETNYTFPTLEEANSYSQGQQQSVTPQQLVSLYTKIIAIWNNQNENLLAGTVVMRYRPDIRVGMRMVLSYHDGHRVEGYVQTLTHNYQAQGESQTVVTVVRGIAYDVNGNNMLGVILSLDAELDKLGIQSADTFAASGQ
jgi:hypothetical protein